MNLYSLPALVALIFKLVLLLYALWSPVKNKQTALFLLLLITYGLHNLSEVLFLNYLSKHGVDSVVYFLGYGYFATLIPSIAILLHVSLRFALTSSGAVGAYALLYLPPGILEYLLLFTDKLVIGFEPFQAGGIRIPGPLYFLFEGYLILYLALALAILVYGAHTEHKSVITRIQNRLWLIGLAPMALFTIYLIVSRHTNWPQFSSTFYVPITQTFFLLITTYATHQYRLFDIEFFLPWSKTRTRKMDFYRHLESMAAQIPTLPAIDSAVALISQILRCPVVLVRETAQAEQVVEAGDEASEMASFPKERLQQLDQLVVAAEIRTTIPDLYQTMKQFNVAAIAPLHSGTPTEGRGWLLLGRQFNERIYSPADFVHAERLFHALAQQTREVEKQRDLIKQKLVRTETLNAKLRRSYRALMRQTDRAVDTSVANPPLEPGKSFDDQVEAFEASLLRHALQRAGSKSEAARLLGLRPNTLYYKMKRYQISSDMTAETDKEEKSKTE